MGKPEILKASDTIMVLLLVATSLLEWLGASLEHKSGWERTAISHPSSGTEDRGFLNTKRWAKPDAHLTLWLFVASNAITPRSWRRVIVYTVFFVGRKLLPLAQRQYRATVHGVNQDPS